jgi:hypothetical protein
VKVIDMRGPSARVHATLADAAAAAAAAGGGGGGGGGGAGQPPALPPGTPGAELLYNVRLLRDSAQAELTVAHRRGLAARTKLSRVLREAAALRADAAGAEAEAGAVGAAAGAVGALAQRARAALAPLLARASALAGAAAPATHADSRGALLRDFGAALGGAARGTEELLALSALRALPRAAGAPLRRALAALLAAMLARLPQVWPAPGEEALWGCGGLCAPPPAPVAALLGGLRAWLQAGARWDESAFAGGTDPAAPDGALLPLFRGALAAALSPLLCEALRCGGGAAPAPPPAALRLATALAPAGAYAPSPSAAFPSALAAAARAGLPLRPSGGAGGKGDLLPLWAYARALQEVALPLLLARADAWEPTCDAAPVCDWALPWGAPHLLGGPPRGEAGGGAPLPGAPPVAALWARLRDRVEDALTQWHPSDPSAAALLAPWAPPLWGEEAWGGLLARAVAPQLRCALREAAAAPGAAPPPGPIDWLQPWLPLLPRAVAVPLLEGDAPLAWLGALAARLGLARPAPPAQPPRAVDFPGAAAWYSAWGARLAAALESCPSLQPGGGARLRARAAALIAAAVEAGEGGCSWEAARARAGEALAPLRLAGARTDAATAAAAAPAAQHRRSALLEAALAPHAELPVGASAAAGPSFRDVVEAAAAAEGLAFAPAPRRGEVDGCPVFKLGAAAHAYVNNGVLWVDAAAGGGFKPVSVEEGVAAAKAAQAAAAAKR